MQRFFNKYKWILAAWVILWGCNPSSAYASMQTPRYASWNTQKVHLTSAAAAPAYQFRTTSTYRVNMPDFNFTPLADQARGGAPARIRKGGYGTYYGDTDDNEDDPEGPGVGELEDPTPIGSPLILLFMALLYLFIRIPMATRKSAEK